ncbi:MAG TPA: RidA family protein [Acidimicrobiales bacterium]|jgi:2-iminobutanoate/2-iminopropanoate deaminase|nr:RidA family protein [Acidimicrobiales bacterium]
MPAPVGPYSPYARAGDLVVTSGQLGLADGPDGRPALAEGTAAQLAQALRNGEAVLASAGLRKDHVVKATLFLVDMGDFAASNEVWVSFFGDHRPARTAIAVAALPLDARVEVELWACSAGD